MEAASSLCDREADGDDGYGDGDGDDGWSSVEGWTATAVDDDDDDAWGGVRG